MDEGHRVRGREVACADQPLHRVASPQIPLLLLLHPEFPEGRGDHGTRRAGGRAGRSGSQVGLLGAGVLRVGLLPSLGAEMPSQGLRGRAAGVRMQVRTHPCSMGASGAKIIPRDPEIVDSRPEASARTQGVCEPVRQHGDRCRS